MSQASASQPGLGGAEKPAVHDATPTAPPPDVFGAAFRDDPHAVYAKLREEAPVHRLVLPGGAPVWLVTRDEDVRAGLADPRLSVDKSRSRGGYQGFSLPPALDANLLNMDGADHLRLRRLVSQGFTPRRVEAMRQGVQAVAGRLADDLARRLADGDPADLVHHYALPLPLAVVGDLFGVPEDGRRPFASWVRAMLAPEYPAQVVEAIGAMHDYLRHLVRERREAVHGKTAGDDLLSALIEARDAQDRLSEDELCSLAFLILSAGIENVQHVVSTGLLTLLRHPSQLAELRADPGLFPSAVEELLRYAHPNLTAIRRFPTEPVTYGDVTVPAGDTVLLCLASANRDPARYPDPDGFDIHRGDSAHLALGQGMHYCLGAPLARMEIQIALQALLHRFPRLRLAVPERELEWEVSFRSWALAKLPVTEQAASDQPASDQPVTEPPVSELP